MHNILQLLLQLTMPKVVLSTHKVTCVHGLYYTIGVDRISPHFGSLEGGTKVLVIGEGFSTDSYSGANLVFLGEHPCIVNW